MTCTLFYDCVDPIPLIFFPDWLKWLLIIILLSVWVYLGLDSFIKWLIKQYNTDKEV